MLTSGARIPPMGVSSEVGKPVPAAHKGVKHDATHNSSATVTLRFKMTGCGCGVLPSTTVSLAYLPSLSRLL